MAMVTRMSVITTDDLDGSADAQTVVFGLDGVSYEIDLCAKNRARLEKALAPFIAASRKPPPAGRRRAARRTPQSRAESTAVRAWARSAGLKVSERGRISADIMRRYEDAH
jgi:hypothetical protein